MSQIFSYHTFLFPFRFDYVEDGIQSKEMLYKKSSFKQRVDIEKLKQVLEVNGWQYKPFSIDSNEKYGESVYYYDYVNEALFNKEQFDEQDISWNFVKKFDKAKLHFKILKNSEYELEIEQISLRIFFSGVAILVIEAKNCKYATSEDILKINEYARRVYPQFLPLEDAKKSFLPDWIAIELDGRSVTENFQEYETPKMYKIGRHILWMLGSNFATTIQKSSFFIQPILDDRMFVVSWYGSKVALQIAQRYEEDDFWYRYVFVDGGDKSVQDENMQKELINKATYTRWKNYGTLYGVSRYSFVALCDGEWFCKNIILNHMRYHYKDMALYVLTNRATIVRFFDEVGSTARLKNRLDRFYERTVEMYYLYLEFMSRLFFREITPQDQGIELYQKLLGWFNIDQDIKDLENEIEKLHSIADMQLSKEEQKEMNTISKIGFWLLPPTLIAGILGMNIFGGDFFKFESFSIIKNHPYISLASFGLLLIASGIIGEKIREQIIKKSPHNAG